MMNEQVRLVLADILRLPPGAIGKSTSRDNTPTWDSLNHINLVVGLEQEFGISFEVAEIEAMSSFPKVIEIVERKLASN